MANYKTLEMEKYFCQEHVLATQQLIPVLLVSVSLVLILGFVEMMVLGVMRNPNADVS